MNKFRRFSLVFAVFCLVAAFAGCGPGGGTGSFASPSAAVSSVSSMAEEHALPADVVDIDGYLVHYRLVDGEELGEVFKTPTLAGNFKPKEGDKLRFILCDQITLDGEPVEDVFQFAQDHAGKAGLTVVVDGESHGSTGSMLSKEGVPAFAFILSLPEDTPDDIPVQLQSVEPAA